MVNIDKIVCILKKEFINNKSPVSELIKLYTSPFRVLVSALLSSRTRDEITLKACRSLFSVAKDFSDIRNLSVKQIEKLIYPVGFYRVKARNLKKIASLLKTEKFCDKVPDSRQELEKLPGIGRKIANIILLFAFNKMVIPVDTHVHRIMNRIGYVSTASPFETEKELMKNLPKKYWKSINYILVSFGQRVCLPVRPLCSLCPIGSCCKKIGVKNAR